VSFTTPVSGSLENLSLGFRSPMIGLVRSRCLQIPILPSDLRLLLPPPITGASSLVPLLSPCLALGYLFPKTASLGCSALHVAGFQRSDNLIRTLAFRCLLWACVIPPPVTVHGCTLRDNCVAATSHRAMLLHSRRRISAPRISRPLHSQVRQYSRTFSPWAFMDIRHIGYIRASLDFRIPLGIYGTSLPTSAGFTPPGSTSRTHAAVSMGAFQGVTPSFDLSDY
jgi:hypothetical protein